MSKKQRSPDARVQRAYDAIGCPAKLPLPIYKIVRTVTATLGEAPMISARVPAGTPRHRHRQALHADLAKRLCAQHATHVDAIQQGLALARQPRGSSLALTLEAALHTSCLCKLLQTLERRLIADVCNLRSGRYDRV